MYTVKRGLCWKINWKFCYKKCSSFQSHGLIEQPSYVSYGNVLEIFQRQSRITSITRAALIRASVYEIITFKSF